MDRCSALRSETGDFTPLVIAALRSEPVRRRIAEAGLAQPAVVLASAWNEVEKSLDRALDVTLNASPVAIHASDHEDELEVYQSFLYRAAEFVEAVEKQVRAATGKYTAPKKLDKMLSIQCNALKHDHMRLLWISARDDKFRVNGYRFYHHVGKVEEPADRFHETRPAYSFNLEISRLYAAMYLLGEHAGRHVIAAHGSPHPVFADLSPVLVRVMELPRYVFPKERKEPFPEFCDSPFGIDVVFDGKPGSPVGTDRLSITMAYLEGGSIKSNSMDV